MEIVHLVPVMSSGVEICATWSGYILSFPGQLDRWYNTNYGILPHRVFLNNP